jgi:hypothetical protein
MTPTLPAATRLSVNMEVMVGQTMTSPIAFPLPATTKLSVEVTGCYIDASGIGDRAAIDLTFLTSDFVLKTGVRRLIIRGVQMRRASSGPAELIPFFDGRRTVRLGPCSLCGRPCDAEAGICPEWAAAACVLSS